MELDEVRGSPEKMRVQLGWEPQVKFHALIRIMMEHDLKLAAAEAGSSS